MDARVPACYTLLGRIINLAISDYVRYELYNLGYFDGHKYKNRHDNFNKDGKSARSFIFCGRRLEDFLERFDVDYCVSVGYIRRFTRDLLSELMRNKDKLRQFVYHRENNIFGIELQQKEERV